VIIKEMFPDNLNRRHLVITFNNQLFQDDLLSIK
jgi:hypothetical protein